LPRQAAHEGNAPQRVVLLQANEAADNPADSCDFALNSSIAEALSPIRIPPKSDASGVEFSIYNSSKVRLLHVLWDHSLRVEERSVESI
jgi:hypothetical protein